MTETISFESIQSISSFFDSLVSLVPPQHYFVKTSPDEDDEEGYRRYLHNKSGKAPKQLIKEKSKKAKKLKMDPDAPHTVVEQQKALLEKEMENADNVDMEDAPLETTNPSSEERSLSSYQPASSGVELQERLKKRIEELKHKRQVNKKVAKPTEDGTTEGDEKPASRQDIIERRKAKKLARKKSIKKQKEIRKNTSDTIGMAVQTPHKDDQPKKDTVQVAVSFGKIDFSVPALDDPETNDKKRKATNDPSVLLKQVEAKKAKLEKLKETDAEKAERIIEKETWKKLLDKSEGVKVKDDVKLLKKSVKRKESEKKKRSTEWTDRKDQVQKQIAARQEKRQENIQKKIQEKKDKKFGKKSKSSGAGKKKRPGFEGSAKR